MARGNTALWRGDLAGAHSYLVQALALYDLHQYKAQALSPLEDARAVCRYHLAFTLWSLGYPEQALQQIPAALALAQELGSPFGVAGAFHAAAFHHQLRHEAPAAQERIEVSLAVALEHGLPWWEAASRILYGWALSEQGDIAEGISHMRQGLASYQRTGARLVQSYHLTLFAGACGKAGQFEEGLAVLAEALTHVEKRGERFYEAEIYRLKGELMLAQSSVQSLESGVQENQKSKSKRQKAKVTDPRPLTSDPQKEAEACFLKAIEVSRHQQAKSLELRATMSLARLWQQQGKHDEAHKLLSEIYGWFTEGFDTKDLQEAQALLESLESQRV